MLPAFAITHAVLVLCSDVERELGRAAGLGLQAPEPRLRRKNRVRTVQGTAAIEGNVLDTAQVTALLDHKPVRGTATEIREIQNAIAAYDMAPQLRPYAVRDLLRAHATLMSGLVHDAGRFRAGNVGILKGTRVTHVAPPAVRVHALVKGLFASLQRQHEIPLPIRACLAHYELEFIHPFSDGNGRVGRLWQHVMLLGHNPLFAYVPVESIIRERQRHYYAALRKSDKRGDCTAFVELMLGAIRDGLRELTQEARPTKADGSDRLAQARAHFGAVTFTRKDYMGLHRSLSTATASRDLKLGVDRRWLVKRGDRALAQYRFRAKAL